MSEKNIHGRLVIITDLDGTLLHPKTYSYADASPALELITIRDIPLIFCSSKCSAELEVYRRLLKNRHPFIVENGGGIFVPDEYFTFVVEGELRSGYRVIHLGTPYDEIRRQFVSLRARLRIPVRGFGDMTPAEVSSLTGLAKHAAVLAMQRNYDEPFMFPDAPNRVFLQAIEDSGLHWTEGRFFHIMGNHDKGHAVRILKGLFEHEAGPVRTVGLGDQLNDLSFLRIVDKPILVRREDGSYDERINIPGLYRTQGIGPEGWNEAVLSLLLNT